jgi:hypothetical protein
LVFRSNPNLLLEHHLFTVRAHAMGEFALGEVLRRIIEQEHDHLLLAAALGIDAPNIGD